MSNVHPLIIRAAVAVAVVALALAGGYGYGEPRYDQGREAGEEWEAGLTEVYRGSDPGASGTRHMRRPGRGSRRLPDGGPGPRPRPDHMPRGARGRGGPHPGVGRGSRRVARHAGGRAGPSAPPARPVRGKATTGLLLWANRRGVHP